MLTILPLSQLMARAMLYRNSLDEGQLGIQLSAEQLKDESLTHQDEHGRPRTPFRPIAIPDLGHTQHVGCGIDHAILMDEKGRGYATRSGSSGHLVLSSDNGQSIPQRLRRKALDRRTLAWAGAGGRFSTVAHEHGAN